MKILIIGQGIAGSLLAWELFRRKHDIRIIDDAHASCASKVAAGVLTPVTGQRFVLSWEYGRFFSQARQTYNELSVFFKEDLFEEKQTLRIFRSEQERNMWEAKKSSPEFRDYHITDEPALKYKQWLFDPFGSKIMQNSAWCKSPQLLDHLRTFFQAQGVLQSANFNYADVKASADNVEYGGNTYDHAIFCEGYKIGNNPFFSWLTFHHAKGEILLVEAKLVDFPNYILNFGKWALPLGNGRFRVGSTYDWERLDEVSTEEGQKQIMQSVIEQIRINARVLEHQAGVRPVSKDLRPLVGFHPQHPRISLINGLGSKGILRAPYLAKHFADVLENKDSLWKDVDVRRSWKSN